jgi:hypothetical protein
VSRRLVAAAALLAIAAAGFALARLATTDKPHDDVPAMQESKATLTAH